MKLRDIFSRRKIKRNDPCYCGSGKRFKKMLLSKSSCIRGIRTRNAPVMKSACSDQYQSCKIG
ncbi:MAG: SEC-C metal-binding domain-containing protein [Candidatus Levyibacteriota bacterium]